VTAESAPPRPVLEGVAWRKPADQQLWWTREQMHFPRPLCPYTASIECPAMTTGATTGLSALGVPVRYHLANFDGYNYNAIELLADPEAALPEAQARIIGELQGLLERWQTMYLPEVLGLNARLRDFDYAAAPTDELVAQVRWSAAQRERHWEIHMRVVIPVMVAAGELGNQWEAAFGAERREEALALLQGYPNKTVEAAAALWRLSREALASPEMSRLLTATPPRRVAALLATSEAGRAFKARLDAHLQEYGWRSGGFEYADPAWVEDPAVALSTLREFMRQPDGQDPGLVEARAAAAREELLARVAPEIDALPAGPILRMMLAAAQQYLPIQEDHNFYIDQMNTVLMRWPAREAGRRLAEAEAIALAEDVFYLTVDEVERALRDPAGEDWAVLVAERRLLRQHQMETEPPTFLGTPPPADVTADPAFRGIASFFGEPVPQDKTSSVLRGTPASRGVVTGRACVATTLEEAGRLQGGEILVCETTTPAWTPLFAVAAGVVTDTGGALSHSAIVAREYGIPCVVGTPRATRRVRDGQLLTVDGRAGMVTIEPE